MMTIGSNQHTGLLIISDGACFLISVIFWQGSFLKSNVCLHRYDILTMLRLVTIGASNSIELTSLSHHVKIVDVQGWYGGTSRKCY